MMMYGLGCPSQAITAVVFKSYFLSANADMGSTIQRLNTGRWMSPFPQERSLNQKWSEKVLSGTRASVLVDR